MVRGVSMGERAVTHLDPQGQSDFMPDFLDDFLFEHARELDSEARVLDYIGMSVQNAGLNIVESAWTSGEEVVETSELPPPTDVCAEGAEEAVAPSAATTPTVDTSVSPIIDLPWGVQPDDIIDVIAMHPGFERSTLLEIIAECSVVSVSDRQKQTIQQLLDLAFISCKSTMAGVELRIHALNTTWHPGERDDAEVAVQKYRQEL